MPLLDIVEFTDQTEIDELNALLRPGMIISAFQHENKLKQYKVHIDSLLEVLEEPIDGTEIITRLQNLTVSTPMFVPTEDEAITQLTISSAPIDSFMYVLEGSSLGTGKFTTVATKIAMPSNHTPAPMPANLHVVAIMFMNEIDGVNENIELLKWNQGAQDWDNLFTWEVRGARWATIKADDDYTPLAVVNERDLMAIRFVNQSVPAAKDGYVMVYYRMISEGTPGEFVSPIL